MKAIPLKEWPNHLLGWANPAPSLMARPPQRRELTIIGEFLDPKENLSQFLVGTSRDEYGTVLHLTPARDHALSGKSQEEKTKNMREWNRWWAKIAVRSGYLSPSIDPVALATLSDLRRSDSRVDFIVDTNVLVSGVGHWLMRWFGDTCDVVRTVVTDLEVQRFGDRKKWSPSNFEELSGRTLYVTASRFLEHRQEQHPVWRRLDTEEETALFVASASKGGKEPGADTLMLRAVRRSVLDQVPGLVRLFVTSDQSIARAASHDLPVGSTIAAYVDPIPDQGAYLTSVHWWPKQGLDGGAGYMSSLAEFCYEATCLCDTVLLVKPDRTFLRIRSHIPGRNQFPIDWRDPVVWVEEGKLMSVPVTTAAGSPPIAESPMPREERASPAEVPPVAEKPESTEQERSGLRLAIPARSSPAKSGVWPFASTSPIQNDPVACVARVSAPNLLEVLAAIMLAARESRPVSERVFTGSSETIRELRLFLRAVDALDSSGLPGLVAPDLQELFADDDTDGLSRVLTKASEYHSLIEQLRSRRTSNLEKLDVPKRSATALAALARLLGQAVNNNGELVYGGGYISRDDFVEWFMRTLKADRKGPLGGNLIVTISRKALFELSMSPVRLEKAMRSAMDASPLSELDFIAGGTPEHILEEEVAVLNSRGWTRRRVSADGLLGYRSVRRR